MKFPLGQVVMTRGIANHLTDGIFNHEDLNGILKRHVNGDWGEMCKEDKEVNDDGLKYGGRLFSSYKVKNKTVWIITEWDRSVTTFLFPDEY